MKYFSFEDDVSIHWTNAISVWRILKWSFRLLPNLSINTVSKLSVHYSRLLFGHSTSHSWYEMKARAPKRELSVCLSVWLAPPPFYPFYVWHWVSRHEANTKGLRFFISSQFLYLDSLGCILAMDLWQNVLRQTMLEKWVFYLESSAWVRKGHWAWLRLRLRPRLSLRLSLRPTLEQGLRLRLSLALGPGPSVGCFASLSKRTPLG